MVSVTTTGLLAGAGATLSLSAIVSACKAVVSLGDTPLGRLCNTIPRAMSELMRNADSAPTTAP